MKSGFQILVCRPYLVHNPGFKDFPLRSHDYEAVGHFIVERRPESAFATSIIPLIFIGWIGVFGTLIPKESGEKLRSF